MTNKGLEFLKSLESCKLEAYLDVASIPTIGYGNTFYSDGKNVKMGDKISQEVANRLLMHEIDNVQVSVSELTFWKIMSWTENDALISLVYNIGVRAFKTSTILRLINSSEMNLKELEKAWKMWDKAHIDGKLVVVKGLKNRRNREWKLFSEGVY